MEIFRLDACEKQFSYNHLPSRPYPSTTSLAEPWRVSLVDQTTPFTHPYTNSSRRRPARNQSA